MVREKELNTISLICESKYIQNKYYIYIKKQKVRFEDIIQVKTFSFTSGIGIHFTKALP